jgi:hypothetical protein
MSCSDKLAKWGLVGLQGALLSGLVTRPVCLSTVVVAVGMDARHSTAAPTEESRGVLQAVETSLQRAVVGRVAPLKDRLRGDTAPRKLHVHALPVPLALMHELGLAPTPARKSACGASLVWRAPPSPLWKAHRSFYTRPENQHLATSPELPWMVLSGGVHEAAAGASGATLGVARKGAMGVKPGGRLSVCKLEVLRAFLGAAAVVRSLQHRGPSVGTKRNAQGDPVPVFKGAHSSAGKEGKTYREWKVVAGHAYLEQWHALLSPPSLFEGWIPKPPELEQFHLID